MTTYLSTFETDFGDFSVAVSENGAVLATAFGEREALSARFRPGRLIVDEQRTRDAREQITEYLAAKRTSFDLPIAPAGTPFQNRVWTELRKIPRGETRSYGQLAKILESSPRAIGRANATNPICLIVPCHRVIGADGSLTGFAFGAEIKRRLLEQENAVFAVME
ncbi:MAG: methylated-DNA--[protein]-cysteine S-methyltransferase [Nibricoccus sp.]